MKTRMISSLTGLSDDELISRLKRLAAREREVTVVLITHLAELDIRRLYLAEGCSSLFSYCRQVLRLSEHAAYGRIEAARAARRFPIILGLLEEGAITLTTVCLLAGHLTEENHKHVLDAARHRSKRQVEELVACLDPQPPVPSSVRRLPGPQRSSDSPSQFAAAATDMGHDSDALFPMLRSGAPAAPACPVRASTSGAASVPPRPALVVPLAPERYRVQFTASAEMYEKLRLAQALMRHQIPGGDPAAIFDRALTVLLESLTKQKIAATDRPRTQPTRPAVEGAARSRHIPAETRRAVWRRDAGRCAYVSPSGRRCTENGFLEFHHVVPYSSGGDATVDNIQLRCRAHNGFDVGTRSGPSSAQSQPSARTRVGPPQVSSQVHASVWADAHAVTAERPAVAVSPAGEAGSEPSQAIHHSLPGDAGSSGMSDPSNFAGAVALAGQEGDLSIGDHTAFRYSGDDRKYPNSETIASLRSR